ncbi:hypothetical protein [Marinobacterium lutimaris]|uniref:Phage tail protein n=1 Tax=Marinobacterium lutimaris TaxID=568106 RepID=A0A1H5Y8N5_9GAMM|nr:hypothetical protein [Marinobacterium lutimaris]SEG20324.1 hypothetical protein SAMN05444390_1011661 [Marinobacterium lutimaris]
MAKSLRERMLANCQKPRKTDTVNAGELLDGETVTVVQWTSGQRDQFDKLLSKERLKESEALKNKEEYKATASLRAVAVRVSVVDPETLEQVFTDEDLPLLENANQTDMNRIYQAAISLNPLIDIDAAAKN